MSESLILDVRNVTKRYDSLEVLKGITLGLKKGETKVVIGPSGSGKSTLLRCINHLTTPDSGEIYLEVKKYETPTSTPCERAWALFSRTSTCSRT